MAVTNTAVPMLDGIATPPARIAAGDPATATAGDRDPAVFADRDRFDVRRADAGAHPAFTRGPRLHFDARPGTGAATAAPPDRPPGPRATRNADHLRS